MSNPQNTPGEASAETLHAVADAAKRGDVLEVHGIPGAPTRRGVIEKVIGEGVHLHYLVRWDEEHESLFYPSSGEGVHVIHAA